MATKGALVVGASRGIGRQIAKTLAKNGYAVGVAAKTVQASDKLPGSIQSVVEEITKERGHAVPIMCDVRNPEHIGQAVDTCIKEFGSLDLAVYNAGAILWNKVMDTPLKRFELLHNVNARGSYSLVHCLLPHFLQRNTGKIILVAPPIYNRFFKGKVPYSMTKIPMTVLVHGLANELADTDYYNHVRGVFQVPMKGRRSSGCYLALANDTGVSICALWPATVIESHVTVVRDVEPKYMRTPHIFADAVVALAEDDPHRINGQAFIDEDYLRSRGHTDFTTYRCDKDVEPPRMMPKKFPSLLVEEEDQHLSKL